MPVDIPKLMATFEGAIRAAWQASGGGGGAGPATVAGPITLAYEPIGLPQPRSRFTHDGSDFFGPATPNLADERVARLADEVYRVASPAADDPADDAGPIAERVNRHAGVLYESALRSARPDPAWGEDRVAEFEAAKGQALRRLTSAKTPSSLTMMDDFLAVRATPRNWYDPAAADIWTWAEFQVRDAPAPPVAAAAAPAWSLLVARAAPHLGFAVAPPGGDPEADPGQILGREPAFFLRDDLDTPAPAAPTPDVAIAPGAVERLADLPLNADILRPVNPAFRPLAVRPEDVRTPIRENHFPAFGAAAPAPAVAAPPDFSLQAALRAFNPRIVKLLQESEVVRPAAESITLSFSTCVVTLDRPWLDWSFWELPGWHAPTRAAGAVAPALWPTLSLAMVLVKDLALIFEKPADLDALRLALKFGPFCLFGRDIREISGFAGWHVEVRVPGIQVIGWALQPVAALPPAGDPAIP